MEWDGRTVGHLQKVLKDFDLDEEFFVSLIILAKQEMTQTAATWLIKRLIESNSAYCIEHRSQLLGLTPFLKKPEAILHFLQILPHVMVQDENRESLFLWLLEMKDHKNTFVRAWAYNGLFLYAKSDKSKQAIVEELMAAAMTSEPASVRARIRNCLKEKHSTMLKF